MANILNYSFAFLVYFASVAVANVERKPNIILFLTDDQDLVLGGMNPMKNVQRFIANEGAVFTNSFVASPICCPSRASILTGLYPHNHGTYNNSLDGGCYGHNWKKAEEHTFATILQENGYNTFYAGKYLNQYGEKKAGGPSVVPPGWNQWHGLVGNSVYYNYTISNNGVPSFSSDLYLTDVIRDLGVTFIQDQKAEEQPFLMVLAPPAPHQPFTPAPRHQGTFHNVTAPRTPNFNIKPENKHWLMRMPPSPLPAPMMSVLDEAFRSRWEALLAVDEMVADIINALDNNDQLHNSYVMFTSDNGYHIGQFSQVFDKRQPYETDIRVPLMIRGPGIKNRTLIHDPTLNVDLAPTIISLAGLPVPSTMDGEPLDITRKTTGSIFKERSMLVEYYGEGSKGTVDSSCPWKDGHNLAECRPLYDCKCQDSRNNTYGCVRHLHPRINYKYCYFSDSEEFEEIYDLTNDPYELHNIVHDVMPAIKFWYRTMLIEMLSCRGSKNCDHPIPENMVGNYY